MSLPNARPCSLMAIQSHPSRAELPSRLVPSGLLEESSALPPHLFAASCQASQGQLDLCLPPLRHLEPTRLSSSCLPFSPPSGQLSLSLASLLLQVVLALQERGYHPQPWWEHSLDLLPFSMQASFLHAFVRRYTSPFPLLQEPRRMLQPAATSR